MNIQKIKLPYEKNAFQGIISEETFEFHYNKHYKNYINKLNSLKKNTEFDNMNLEQIVKLSSGNIFNNAAQVWNHEFYWLSLSNEKIENQKNIFFSKINISEEKLKDLFLESAMKLFGSGWCWLVKDKNGNLSFLNTSNAQTPIKEGIFKPLFVCDVWEHAYYIDFRNDRLKYLNKFWNILNWNFINKNFN
jgi:Fe-Mn family superoxide dismutase